MTEIHWEEPPAHGNSRMDYQAFAAELRRRPGTWALLGDNLASPSVTKIKRGMLIAFAPAGDFEARGQTAGPQRSKVWVRYVGAGEGA